MHLILLKGSMKTAMIYAYILSCKITPSDITNFINVIIANKTFIEQV